MDLSDPKSRGNERASDRFNGKTKRRYDQSLHYVERSVLPWFVLTSDSQPTLDDAKQSLENFLDGKICQTRTGPVVRKGGKRTLKRLNNNVQSTARQLAREKELKEQIAAWDPVGSVRYESEEPKDMNCRKMPSPSDEFTCVAKYKYDGQSSKFFAHGMARTNWRVYQSDYESEKTKCRNKSWTWKHQ